MVSELVSDSSHSRATILLEVHHLFAARVAHEIRKAARACRLDANIVILMGLRDEVDAGSLFPPVHGLPYVEGETWRKGTIQFVVDSSKGPAHGAVFNSSRGNLQG